MKTRHAATASTSSEKERNSDDSTTNRDAKRWPQPNSEITEAVAWRETDAKWRQKQIPALTTTDHVADAPPGEEST